MNVMEAAQTAKTYILKVYADEQVADVGLEEIWSKGNVWNVTIGFSRPWDQSIGSVLAGSRSRSYKIIEIRDSDGEIESMKDRVLNKEKLS